MNTTSNNAPKTNPFFTRRRIVMAACLLIAVGYLLMTGPASTEQAYCHELFSARRRGPGAPCPASVATFR